MPSKPQEIKDELDIMSSDFTFSKILHYPAAAFLVILTIGVFATGEILLGFLALLFAASEIIGISVEKEKYEKRKKRLTEILADLEGKEKITDEKENS